MGVREADARRDLYVAHRAALVEYAAFLLGTREGAEDLVQDAFIRLDPHEATSVAAPRAYLFRIVRNLAFNLRRRRRLETATATLDAAPEWSAPQAIETPEHRVMMIERLRRLARALEALPPESRTILEMHRFEGHTLEQIAETLGLSVATVHRRLRATMASLATEIEESS